MRLFVHIALLFSTLPLLAQSNTGGLRLKVTDPAGFSLKATVELFSDSTQFRRAYQSDAAGILIVRMLTSLARSSCADAKSLFASTLCRLSVGEVAD